MRHIQVQREHRVVTGKGPFVLVKAPTRELAQQICAVFEEAGGACGMRAICIFGGVPKGPQMQALARGVEIAVGTPGRVMDLMESGGLKLNVRRCPLRIPSASCCLQPPLCCAVLSCAV